MALEFKNDTFKIIQIADTQDMIKISPDTLRLIDAALEKISPDLVVFSGDQIWGKNKFKGNKELVKNSLRELLSPVTKREIPFAVAFGNHDRQTGVSNDEQLKIYKSLGNCVSYESESGVDGTANNVIEINDENGKHKLLIYMIDSHTNSSLGYDCIHKNQIEWYKKTRDKYINESGKPVPSIVFQHIPPCEVFELLTRVKKNEKGSVRAFRTHKNEWYKLNFDKVNKDGFMKESPADPDENSGEIAAFSEKGDVVGVYFGHDHNNSFNGKVSGIDLGYTQGAGFHVYGPGLSRGVRVFEIPKDNPESYKTYDLRYRDLCGEKLSEPIRFLFYQIMPTNVFDAVHKGIKILAALAVIVLIIVLLTIFL